MALAIETEQLSKIYSSERKKIYALENLNLQIEEGNVFGFIGPNGAGKTTAIKLFMGLISPTSGKVSIMGKEAGSPESKKEVGYLSEIAYYYTFMEAETLLRYYASLKLIPRNEIKDRIDINLKLVGLDDRKKQKLKSFSKGMLQRFGIALSLIGNPKLLILDEPTSGLDPIGRKEVKDIIKRLKNKGITIFLSSHHLSEVETVCDTIGVINKGKMVCIKKLADLLNYDKKVYTLLFTNKNQKINSILTQKGFKIREEKDGFLRLTTAQENLSEVFKMIAEAEETITDLFPGYSDLEETFFNLIMPEKANSENLSTKIEKVTI